jgi:hypothetical protein
MDGQPEASNSHKEQTKGGDAAPGEIDVRAREETPKPEKQFYIIPPGAISWFDDAFKSDTLVLRVISAFEYGQSTQSYLGRSTSDSSISIPLATNLRCCTPS